MMYLNIELKVLYFLIYNMFRFLLLLCKCTLCLSVVVELDYNNNANSIQACKGVDIIQITWQGLHNIMETSTSSCTSSSLGERYPYINSGTVNFPNDNNEDLGAEPGETRYYKCDLHCQSGARFEVTCPLSSSDSIVCVENHNRILTVNNSYKKILDIRVGDILKTSDSNTTVIKIIHQRSNDQPWYIPKGVCNSIVDTVISPSHAIKCDGKWIDVRNIGQREDKPRNVEYINLQTNNYCNDELILESGLVIESWDGRNHNEWRPKDCERINYY